MTKLNKDLAVFIIGDFHLHGYSTMELAKDYEVSQRQVQKIVKGETWKDAYQEGMKMVSRIKKTMGREKKEPEPIAVTKTPSGNSPFEVMSFISEDGDKERTGVFIDAEAIHEGMLKSFTPTQLKTLLAIFAHTDEINSAFPSQERISKLTGMNKSTVNKNAQALGDLEVTDVWTGKETEKAIQREKVPAKNNPYEMTIYNFSEKLLKQRDIDDLNIDKEETKKITADVLAKLFTA